ncbi:RidA family protein [Cognatiyoonia sp. IB215446]|uniref:RidA family protein n=1 Tax=Cognatiyoonia sp. IB215446 TaxID=3097355 RepID=UPI002A112560|nr:RidA family protein [Cognatiyoonia sp. IB215446]MDX8350321.1 RidA family protein [Cognatiyoonia sp. IB215446]
MTQRGIYPQGVSAADIPLKLSPGIISNGHLFLTGMTGSGPDQTMPDDPDAQFHAAFQKIANVLIAADLDFGAVVEMTSYHVDLEAHFDAFSAVHAQYVKPPYPAWTAVEIAGLRRKGALVEIRVIARLD